MTTPLNLVSDKPPFRSLLLITLTLIIGVAIVGQLLAVAAASHFYSGDMLKDLEEYPTKPGLRDAFLIAQGTITFVGLICFPLIHIKLVEHKSLRPFFFPPENILNLLLIVAVIGIAFPISISPLAAWNQSMDFPDFMSDFESWAMNKEDQLARLTEAMTVFNSVQDMLIGMFVIGLLPAIGEELVFRGMIQHELWRATSKPHLAIWLSAGIFSAIHFQFYGFVPRVLLGALFGYLYYWTGSLLVPMFSHFVNNAFIVLMVYLNQKEMTTVDIEDGEAAPTIYVIAGAVISIGLIYYIWKNHRDIQKKEENNSFSGNGPLV